MKLLIDMNLSPLWESEFRNAGFESSHWSSLGAADADDEVIFKYADEGGWVVVTMDLDFTAILANTGAKGPSVVQIRAIDVSPSSMRSLMISSIKNHQEALEKGAILSLETTRGRIRLLPLSRD